MSRNEENALWISLLSLVVAVVAAVIVATSCSEQSAPHARSVVPFENRAFGGREERFGGGERSRQTRALEEMRRELGDLRSELRESRMRRP